MMSSPGEGQAQVNHAMEMSPLLAVNLDRDSWEIASNAGSIRVLIFLSLMLLSLVFFAVSPILDEMVRRDD